jgi:non-specific serine/threonine protein kinase
MAAAPAAAPGLASALAPAEAAAGNLPAARGTLIGRAEEVAQVQALFAGPPGAARLVTVTGAGGVGKTALAVQVGRELRGAFPDGAWLVELAPIADPALVPGTAAAALGARAAPGAPPLEALVALLRDTALLLVLDNAEHVLEGCAALAGRVLDACPGVRLLVTSREPLRVAGERLLRLRPLAAPDLGGEASPDGLAGYPAVALFVERAQAAAPDFRLTAQNAAAVGQVCARLGGLPLALELAAARVSVLALDQIAARLDDALRLLAGNSPVVPPRQQTLRAALDWSFGLLTPPEQVLFRRLAVFAGGCDLGAVEAVCGDDNGRWTEGEPGDDGRCAVAEGDVAGGEAAGVRPSSLVLRPQDVLDVLGQLVDKSLVVADTGAAGSAEGGRSGNAEARHGGQAARYRLLEPVRQYGWERLGAAGEANRVRRRHAGWCAALAAEAAPELWGPGEGRWLDRLEREHGNLRAALDTLAEAGDAEGALELCATLTTFWGRHGYVAEGRAHLARMLALPGAAHSAARAAALVGAGRLAARQGDYRAQEQYDTASLALARQLGDQHAIAATLTDLAGAAFKQGRYAGARAYLEEALALSRALGDASEVATALMRLGALLRDLGEFDAAAAHFDECLATNRALGSRSGIGHTLSNMGWLALYRGDLDAARSLQEESLAIRRELGDTGDVGTSLTILGLVAGAAGDRRAARALHAEGLEIHRRVGNAWGTALALEGLAAVAAPEHPRRALRLAGAADALRTTINRPVPPAAQPLWDGALAPVRRALGAAAAAAWAEGQAAPLDAVLAEAEAATHSRL